MPHLEATLKEAATNDCKTDFAAGEAVCCALARGDFLWKKWERLNKICDVQWWKSQLIMI